jgi:hypothetical protein
MADDELEIEITSCGKVTLRTIGIRGARCLDHAEMFARILGREESRTITAEYYEESTETYQEIAARECRD